MCGACGRWSLDSVSKKGSLRMIVVNELLSFAVNDFSAKKSVRCNRTFVK